MPISSSAGRARVSLTSSNKRQTENWTNVKSSFAAVKRSQQVKSGSKSRQLKQSQDISQPTSLTSTSAALRSAAVMASTATDTDSTNFLATSTYSLHHQPVSLMGEALAPPDTGSQQAVSNVVVSHGPKSSSYLVNNLHFSTAGKHLSKGKQQASFASLTSQQQEYGRTGSTIALSSGSADIHDNNNNDNNLTQTPGGRHLSIKRSVNLKYVKTLIIVLVAIDLLITVFVHQFASADQVGLWFIAQFKLRVSLINLVFSAIWSVVLIGGILFDSYAILLLSCIIDSLSFVLLVILSAVHFTRRIDYNTVSLTSLLALLFSIIVLHVYLLAMLALTIYLMLAVKRRRN